MSLCGGLAALAVTSVELGEGLVVNALEHLLGEEAQERPAQVQRVVHGTVLVGAWQCELSE